MRHFIAGAVCGAALAGMTVYAVSRPAPSAALSAATGSATPATAAVPATPAEAPRAESTRDAAAACPPAPAAPPLYTPAVMAAAPAAEARRVASAPGSVSPALPPTPPLPPLALPAEHAKMLLSDESARPTLPDLHARLLAEPKHDTWSAATEDLIRQGLADLGPNVELHAVECRRTLCEILAFGNDANAPREWQQAMAKMQGTLKDGGGILGNTGSITGQNGRFAIVNILQRKP